MPANVLLSGEATSTFVALALHAPGVELKAAVKPLSVGRFLGAFKMGCS